MSVLIPLMSPLLHLRGGNFRSQGCKFLIRHHSDGHLARYLSAGLCLNHSLCGRLCRKSRLDVEDSVSRFDREIDYPLPLVRFLKFEKAWFRF